MTISLVTPTGSRPEALALCYKWMMQQTLPFDEWIIVDDSGKVKIDHPRIAVIQNRYKSENTQAESLYLGLFDVNEGYVFIIEDDDYYPPSYIQHMVDTMVKAGVELVGEIPASYYHVGVKRYRKLNNVSYSCLCSCVMTRRVSKLLLGIVAADIKPIDTVLWDAVRRSTNLKSVLVNTKLVVGIKGMPGRANGGVSWNPELGEWTQDDENLTKLQELIPRKDDFQCYKELIEKQASK